MSSIEPSVVERYHRSPMDERDPLVRIAQRIPQGAAVLDVGCATGALAALLAPRGCVVDGIERDVAAAAIARPRYRRLVVADLDASGLENLAALEAYDFVVFADVLEHLRDPLRLLRACRERLGDAGRLLLSVPNVTYAPLLAELLGGRLDYRVSGLLDRTHLRLWTLSSLLELAMTGGFEVAAVDPVERPAHAAEFDTRYLEALPQEVAAFLGSVPGSTAYQWLLELAPATGASSRPDPAPAAATAMPVLFPISLLWRSAGESFDRARAVTAHARVSDGRQRVELTLPRGLAEVSGLALELACRPATFEILELRVYGPQGRLLASLDGHRLARLNWHGAATSPGDGGTMLLACSRRGASVELPLDGGAPVAGGARIVLELEWPEAVEVLPWLARMEARIERLAELHQTVPAAGGTGAKEAAALREAVDHLTSGRGRDHAAWDEERQRLAGHVQAMAAELTGAVAERDALREAQDAAQRTVQDLTDRLGQREAELRSADVTARAMADQVAELAAQLQQATAATADLAARLASSDAQGHEAATLAAEVSSRLAERDAQLQQALATIRQAEAMAADLAARLADREALLHAAHVEQAALWARLGELERDREWMISTPAWRWRERLVSRPGLVALYRRLKRV